MSNNVSEDLDLAIDHEFHKDNYTLKTQNSKCNFLWYFSIDLTTGHWLIKNAFISNFFSYVQHLHPTTLIHCIYVNAKFWLSSNTIKHG